jgi:hypothetical protein
MSNEMESEGLESILFPDNLYNATSSERDVD